MLIKDVRLCLYDFLLVLNVNMDSSDVFAQAPSPADRPAKTCRASTAANPPQSGDKLFLPRF